MRTISAEFFTVVTDVGTRKMLQAVHEGRKVDIVEFAVGDGRRESAGLLAGAETLQNEVWRGRVNSCKISGESENILVVEGVISAEVGGFTIREMGVFDDDGDLIAVCNTPDTAKVRIVDGVLSELIVKMEIILTNTESVNLTVDPAVVTASKADLEKVKKDLEQQVLHIASSGVLAEKIREAFAAAFDTGIIIAAFRKVYKIEDDMPDPTAMTAAQVSEALERKWAGETSGDPAAMTAGQVAEALGREWDGETSGDPAAMTAGQVADALKQ